MAELFGFLNINKPVGMTSHDVVSAMRRITKIKQIWHTGTLDPFAQGVLLVCIGKSTRLIEYLEDDKEYLATVQFGQNTDTYDIEGTVTETFDKKITKDELLSALIDFEGNILQYPPKYSAIKVGGKKLYEYARNNQEVEIKPRNVYISKIELKSFDDETQQAQILIGCSKGTYIRSIAFDLGKNLSCGGHLVKLIRTKAGKFNIETSVNLDDLKTVTDVEKSLINPLSVLNYPQYKLNEFEYKKIINGNSIKDENIKDYNVVILVYSDKIKSVAYSHDGIISVRKVL